MRRDEALEKAQRAVNAEYPRKRYQVGDRDLPLTSSTVETIAVLEALGLVKFTVPLANDGPAELDDALISLIRTDLQSGAPAKALREDLAKCGLALVKVPCAS